MGDYQRTDPSAQGEIGPIVQQADARAAGGRGRAVELDGIIVGGEARKLGGARSRLADRYTLYMGGIIAPHVVKSDGAAGFVQLPIGDWAVGYDPLLVTAGWRNDQREGGGRTEHPAGHIGDADRVSACLGSSAISDEKRGVGGTRQVGGGVFPLVAEGCGAASPYVE